jgi:hypothetical protein
VTIQCERASVGSDNRVRDPDLPRSGGELVPLRPTTDNREIRLELPRLESLTAAQEAEAVELLAALLAAAARHQAGVRLQKEAA